MEQSYQENTQPPPERLRQLAAFAPRLRDPQAAFGQWRGGEAVKDVDEYVTMPWFALSDWAAQFVDMLYRAGWVLQGLDWREWAETSEGKALMSDAHVIATADNEQLGRLLTALVRQDRFCEGTLAKAFEDGLLLATVERADRLLIG